MIVNDLFTIIDLEKGNNSYIVELELQPLENTAEEVRAIRNTLLELVVDKTPGSAIRWSLMTNEEQEAWVLYRQALLDIPEQEGFPSNVIWPTTP